MKAKETLSYTFSALMVVGMVFLIVILVRGEFFGPSTSPQARGIQPHPRRLQTRQISNWQQLKFTGQRTGPADAPVQIVEFFDYECPFCKASEPAIKAIRQKYSQKVAVVHEDFPLVKIHPYALKASVAAECVRRQNPGLFMAYHDALFTNQDRLGKLSYTQLAERVGIADTTSFHRCVKTQKTVSIIKTNKALGKKLHINGTPTFIINSTLVIGEISKRKLNGLVQNALAKAGK